MSVLPAKPAAVTCSACEGICCRLQVLLFDDPGVPESMVDTTDWGGQVMRRLEDGWCVAIDRNTLRCSIYERRPQLCRDYEMGGQECRDEQERTHLGSVVGTAISTIGRQSEGLNKWKE